MPNLTIVAHIIARPEQVELVKSELLGLIAPTRAEAGCVQYDLHQDDEHPTHFMFFENWTTRDLWRAHMESPHLKAMQAAVEDAVESVTIHEMRHIG
jgi:quinol monooxygenase YgiN